MITDHTAALELQQEVCQADIALKTQDNVLAADCQQANHAFDHIIHNLVEDIRPFFENQCQVERIIGDTPVTSVLKYMRRLDFTTGK